MSAPPRDQVAACILAGGRARRLGGRAKPLLPIDGVTIAERLQAAIAPLAADVFTAVADAAQAPPGLRAVIDAHADAGPLAGIAAARAACRAPWLIVVAGDMPFVSTEALAALLALAAPAIDAIAPLIGGLPEPLMAIYGAACGPVAVRRLAAGRRKVAGLLTDEGLRVAWLHEDALRAVDPALRCLVNINRPEDVP